MFYCNNPECGVKGDVIQFWFELLKPAGLYRADWSLLRAAGDLIERVESGEIDVSIREFDDDLPASRSHGQRRAKGESYISKLRLIKREVKVIGSEALPRPVRISVREVVLGLFPENRLLMITPKREWHDIKLRNEWLKEYVTVRPRVPERSFVSQNYLSRADLNCFYEGMEGVERRWLVIEGDSGTLEQQWWIHKQLSPACLCWSGGKSLHGGTLVEGWTEEQCFDLYAQAIRLGITDCNTWKRPQPVRLPAGWNCKTMHKQNVLVWQM